jgi:hypothetical protein
MDDAGDLIVPSHGQGRIRPAWPAGRWGSQGHASKASSMRAIRKRVRELAVADSEEMYLELRALANDPDSRVRMIAVKEYFDRFHGVATATGMIHDENAVTINIDRLNEEERARLFAALDTVKALTGDRNE